MVMNKPEIIPKQLFYFPGIQPQWTGVSGSLENVEFLHPEDKLKINSHSCDVQDFSFTNGWNIISRFSCDNMGCGFGSFVAYKSLQPYVFGCYETGVYCTNEETLKEFVSQFPYYQTD